MSEITKAIQFLCDEKNLSYDSVMEAIEFALAAAYRKDFGNKQQNIKVKFDPETGDMQVWDVKTVVEDIPEDKLEAAQEELIKRREKAREEGRELTDEEIADLPRFNPKTEMMISVAKEIKKKSELGEVLEISLEIPHDFGRMAAQTAKQVIIQKIREAERNMVFEDFKGQEGQLVVGTIQRVEGRKVLVDLGKTTGILPSDQQIQREHYRPGSKIKFFIVSVAMTTRGPEILLSRADAGMVREVFKQEIPEMADRTIEIKGIARDAGFRSKVSVFTSDEQIDPIGSCIGQRGSRINTIIEELGGEKIDVIQYSEDSAQYIAHALSPAKVSGVKLDEANKVADVFVVPEQFSLAIGRSGQNVRLAAQLTGWKINVNEQGGENKAMSDEQNAEEDKKEDEAVEEEKTIEEKE
ncbi:MAG: NusA antitermination factor [Candidatus Magasanikbacteria bacterium GW2011_GWA2_46_17]|uniref:Transcription termination/antitermination protein NusA n=1 Tax=Candidatus Magasanikbacteria bacterium GW2011_GWA2_46_17 TaxID=1619042 RepID=A0A0G1P346_9BACT|nr:MAG: NusA antitermination factor [Candidatus Magasanikbacteria bacterium GW2011_GWA2_46_17]